MRSLLFQIRHKKKRKAFSLGEVLISAFVLTVGLTATTALIASSLNYTYNNRDAVIGAQLAQEGVELVRNVRDQNFAIQKDGGNGGDGFNGFDTNQKNCRIDNQSSLTCFSSQGSPSGNRYYLQTPVNPGGGDRFYHSSTPDRFARYIYVDYDNANKSARVVSYVFWDWSNGGNMPSYIPSNGNTSFCNVASKCVFSEVYLSKWGIL